MKKIIVVLSIVLVISCKNARDTDPVNIRNEKQATVEQLYKTLDTYEKSRMEFIGTGLKDKADETQRSIDDLRKKVSDFEKQGYYKEDFYPDGKKTSDLNK